jgi:hypothetical protein
MPRVAEPGATAIGDAIKASVGLFSTVMDPERRRKIDVSGDGRANVGTPLDAARREARARNITINGLAIENEVRTLGKYYEYRLIEGESAFVEVAADYADFEKAVLRKLLKEIGVELISDKGPSFPPDGLSTADRRDGAGRVYAEEDPE